MAAALNPQLTAMLAALDAAQPGLGNEFVAHVGATMDNPTRDPHFSASPRVTPVKTPTL